MTLTDDIRAAVARVDRDPAAGTRKGSHTMQTRRVAAALRAVGLKRGEFSARVTYERDGGGRVYGHAIGSPRARAGTDLLLRHADAIAAAGFRVFLIGECSHFIASGGTPGVIDMREPDDIIRRRVESHP